MNAKEIIVIMLHLQYHEKITCNICYSDLQ